MKGFEQKTPGTCSRFARKAVACLIALCVILTYAVPTFAFADTDAPETASTEQSSSEAVTVPAASDETAIGEPPLPDGISTLGEGVYPQATGITVQYHTKKEVATYLRNSGATVSDPTTYQTSPLLSAPYSAGTLTSTSLNSAIKMFNQVRYIAGIDYNVTLDSTYNQKAQAAALVNAVNGGLSHYPTRPNGMSDDLYSLGYSGAGSCNLAAGAYTLNYSTVYLWMSDDDSGNISHVGHRRWILNPKMGKTGFGFVANPNSLYRYYSAHYSFDTSNSSAAQTGVAWPAQTMPIQYFSTSDPWSISMGTTVNINNVTVTLKRASDNKIWTFSKNGSNGYFNVNNDGYGQTGCIIFRPDGMGTINDGDKFTVTISGLASPVSYEVNFFDLNTYAEGTMTASLSSPYTSIAMSAGNIASYFPLAKLSFAVWGDKDGQNDLKWYDASLSGSTYSTSALISNHKEPGLYYIHAYATLTNGKSVFIGSSTVTVPSASGTVAPITKNDAAGTFTVKAENISPADLVGSLKVAVWTTANGKDDLKWYTMSGSGGTYTYQVSVANHNSEYGAYNAEVYIVQKNGVEQSIGTASVTLTAPLAAITASLSADQTQISVYGNNITRSPGISSLQYAVWGEQAVNGNTQNDLRWYTANKSGNNYTYTVPVSNHKETGVYYIHAYATLTNGTTVFVGATSVTVQPLTGSVTSPAKSDTAGTFTVQASGIAPSDAADSVRVAIWSAANGQDDLRWYTMSKSGSTYSYNMSFANHNYEYGTYYAHVYAKQKNGSEQFIGAASVTLTAPPMAILASLSADQTQISLSATNVVRSPGVQSVQFAVWGTQAVNGNAQNDLRWYVANRSGNNYTYTVPVSNHKETGTYYIHIYATLTNGATVFIGGTSATVQPLTGSVSSLSPDVAAGTFTVKAEGLAPAVAGSSVRVAVWSAENGQDDLKWYPMTNTSGAYAYSVNIKNHNYEYGTYYAHVYATQKNGIEQFIGSAVVTLNPPAATVTATKTNSNTVLSLSAQNVVRPPGVSYVQFAVWGSPNGQNDLKWYTGTKSGNNYTYSVPVANHGETGLYYVHVYAKLTNGASVFIGATTVTV